MFALGKPAGQVCQSRRKGIPRKSPQPSFSSPRPEIDLGLQRHTFPKPFLIVPEAAPYSPSSFKLLAVMAATQMTASRLLVPSTGISNRRSSRPARAVRVFASTQV